MIRLENIKKSYYNPYRKESRIILNGVHLFVEQGEMIAIMGRSGAGKTTLLQILSGLIQVDSGEYFFEEQLISNISQKKRDEFREKNIGMIVQDYALLTSLSVKDNILLPFLYRKEKGKDKIDQMKYLAKQVGIEQYLEKPVYELSGGEAQRVAIVRAMIKKPKILLADEPTGSLDLDTEKEVLKLLQELKNEENTIILVTHSKEVATYCDRILELKDGKLY